MIETKRLFIKPLDLNQLQKYLKNDNSLERELCVGESIRIISPELKEALEMTFLPLVAENEADYLFFTLWTVILKSVNRMVGDLCFRGTPDDNGSIEIGYGTYQDFRGNGFMTEAVGGMIAWAKTHPAVKSVIAETDKTNVASMRILQKNGFAKSGESFNFFQWKLQL